MKTRMFLATALAAGVLSGSAAAQTVKAGRPEAAALTLPGGGGPYALTLQVVPVAVAREEGFVVAVIDPAAPDAPPLAVFTFYPPPQIGKATTFAAPVADEWVAAARAKGLTRLAVDLRPLATATPPPAATTLEIVSLRIEGR